MQYYFQDVPSPTAHYISRWYRQPHINMAFSFIPVAAGNDTFDNMGRDVVEKLYFAGEVGFVTCYLEVSICALVLCRPFELVPWSL